MKKFVANVVSGAAGIVAAVLMLPSLLTGIIALGISSPLLAATIVVMVPGMVAGSLVAVVEWAIEQYRHRNE